MSLSTVEDPVFRAEYDTEFRLKYPDPRDDQNTGPGSQFDRGVQHALSLQRGECRGACAHEEVVKQKDDQLWALQSHVDRARNDAARYKSRCQEHINELQASKRKVLEFQQDLELANSQMASLQSSSMEARRETWQLKLSKNRVEKELQTSKDQCASLQYELSQHTASHSQHVDELTLQLKNAKQELSQRNASHSQHVDELHIQLENVNKELSLLQGTRSVEWDCLQADVKGKNGQLEAKDQQLSDLRGQLSKQQDQVEQLQAQLHSLRSSIKDSSEDKAGDRNRRGQVVNIAATAGPLPHHQPSMSGTPPQEGSSSSSTLEPDVLGMDSRPNGGLSEVEVTGVTMSESGAPAANPATTPNFTPAVAHAAQGPAPVPITRADSPLPTPEEGPTPPLIASSPAPVFGPGSTGADRHASPPASDEASEAQDAGNGGAPQAAAQGPVPSTRAASPVPMPEEGPAPTFAASGPCPVFGFGPTDADRHAGPPASDEAQDLGNGGAPQAAPAPHPTPSGGPPAVGGFTFAAPGANFGLFSFAGATASSAPFGGGTVGSAPTAADLPSTPFTFSGTYPFAGRDSRQNGELPEVEVTGINMSESAAAAADPATTPLFTPAVAHAAQGPAPSTRAASPVPMPEEGPAPPFASGACPVFGSGSTGADRHAGPPASDEAPEAQHAGNGGAPSPVPAAHPTPPRHAADPPAFGAFSCGPSSGSFSAFAGAAASTTTFGGATSTTDEGKGKGRATAGIRSAAKSKAGKTRVKTKAATAAVPIATAATAGAELPTTAFSFSGVNLGPSTSSAGTADAFDQCMSGLHSLANSIAGPQFVPPQQHDFQGLNSLGADNAAVAAFMGQQHQQLLLTVDQATAEGKHALAVQLLTQVLGAAYAFGTRTHAELAILHGQRAIGLAAAGRPLAAFFDNLTSVKLDMSSPVGAYVADQLARWGFTAEMESFVSRLEAACWPVTHKLANLKLTSCTSTWRQNISQLGQALREVEQLQVGSPGDSDRQVQQGEGLLTSLTDLATKLPAHQALACQKALLELKLCKPEQALATVLPFTAEGEVPAARWAVHMAAHIYWLEGHLVQAHQTLVRLPQSPEAGRLQNGVAYEASAIDDTLLPKLQALALAWLEIRESLLIREFALASEQLNALRSRQKDELASVMSPGCCAEQAMLSAAVHSGLASTKGLAELASEAVKALMACELAVALQPSRRREAFYVKLQLLDLLQAFRAKLELVNSMLADPSFPTHERAFVEQVKLYMQDVHGGRLNYQLLFGLKEPVRWNRAKQCAIGFTEGVKLRRAKLKLAQLHSTDKARKWFSVDFEVGGFGFQDDIACKLGAQATQRRLACREVAQLINCAVDDLLGDRRSGHDPDPEDAYPRNPPSGSAEGHNGSAGHGGASGDHGGAFGDCEAGSGNSNSTNSDSAPSGDQASGSGDWRGGAGGYDGVILRLEMPQAEPFEYQQGSQLHPEASQDAYSDCTDCECDSEIPPWEEDSPSDSGPQLSVREQKWAAELHTQNDET